MTSDALLLVGRDAGRARPTMETHAGRLSDRDVVDDVHVATYDVEPARELEAQLAAIDADRVFALPTSVAHSYDSLDALPGALSRVDADVRYCEPLGRSPAVTDLLARRASAVAPGGPETSLALVGLGSSRTPHWRQVLRYQAERLRQRTAYDDVATCYLVQNPTVECVRYDVSTDRIVALPLFLAECEATEDRIPAKLEVDRGGVAYGAPLGEHPLVTDAIEAELAKQRALSSSDPVPDSFEDALVQTRRTVATDGRGS